MGAGVLENKAQVNEWFAKQGGVHDDVPNTRDGLLPCKAVKVSLHILAHSF